MSLPPGIGQADFDAAVAPSTVEEVQAIMRIANERSIPIYPISPKHLRNC
jgi:FAD/FMN-containing dehydrogenase